MASSTGQAVANAFTTFFTGIGATFGLTRVYNADDSYNNLQIAQEQVRLAQVQQQTQAEKNKTILTAAGAIVVLILLIALFYYAFIRD